MTDSAVPALRQSEVATSAGDGDAGKERRRSAAQIEADLEATAQRLSANIDALVDRLSPKHVARSSVRGAKGLLFTDRGRPRPELIGAVAGALVGAAVLVLWRRR
ncbi:MAG TPA: DUF3618 domain-containing protein [Jiangellaceae bacterium]